MSTPQLTGADIAAVLRVLSKEKADQLLAMLPVDLQNVYAQHQATGNDVVAEALKRQQGQRDAPANPLTPRKDGQQ